MSRRAWMLALMARECQEEAQAALQGTLNSNEGEEAEDAPCEP